MYQLFNAFAHRYDLHTPADHYKHDHQMVLDLAAEIGPHCRILDVGCGTGTFLEKALAAEFDAKGLDVSEGMIAAAQRRLPPGVARVQRMQDLDEKEQYDLIVSLSWSIHYCSGETELLDIFRRMQAALVPGGKLLLQVAHAPNLDGKWMEDREPGPDGEPDDISLRFRFRPNSSILGRLHADYFYECVSRAEKFEESHVLEMADASAIAQCAKKAGFLDVELWNSWRKDVFATSSVAWVKAVAQ